MQYGDMKLHEQSPLQSLTCLSMLMADVVDCHECPEFDWQGHHLQQIHVLKWEVESRGSTL